MTTTTTYTNRRTGRRDVALRPEPETIGRLAASPCPPRLYPLVWYAREECAAALETGHAAPMPGFSVPSHVVSFPLRFSQWHMTTYGDRLYIGVKSILEHEIERDELLVKERGEAWKRAREMRPEHVEPEVWEVEIVEAMRAHESAEDVMAALGAKATGAES